MQFKPKIVMVIYEILLKLVCDETFEDAKGVIRNGKSKVRQVNGQMKKVKQWCTKHFRNGKSKVRQVNGQTKKTNSDIQNISQKSKDRVKYGGDLGFYWRGISCSICGTRHLFLINCCKTFILNYYKTLLYWSIQYK